MLGKTKLTKIARTRLTEARILHRNKKYDGAVYLCGYATELALKKKIIEVLNWRSYPESKKEFEDLRSFKVHALGILLKLSGQEKKLFKRNKLLAKWQIIQGWDPEVRYREIGKIAKVESKETIDATEALLKFLGL